MSSFNHDSLYIFFRGYFKSGLIIYKNINYEYIKRTLEFDRFP